MWSKVKSAFVAKHAHYNSIDTESDIERSFQTPQSSSLTSPRTNLSRYLSAFVHSIVYVLACWALVSLVVRPDSTTVPRSSTSHPKIYQPDIYRPKSLPPGINSCDCGITIREALSRGCAYDSLSAGWLPPYCRDDELSMEFEHAGPGVDGAWSYFADEDGQEPLNKTEIAALGGEGASFWVSRDWHIAHCLFYWQKYIRMRETGVIMEASFDTIHHAKHCTRLVMNPKPDHSLLIEVEVRMNSSEAASD